MLLELCIGVPSLTSVAGAERGSRKHHGSSLTLLQAILDAAPLVSVGFNQG